MRIARLLAASLTLLGLLAPAARAADDATSATLALTGNVAQLDTTPVTAPAANAATAPAVVASVPEKTRLVFTLRYGVDSTPEYPGSSENETWHDFGLKLHYLRLFGHEFGHPDPDHEKYGFRLRPAMRIVNGRDPSENPELAGTDYLYPTIEVGIGAVYTHRKFEIYGDALYGLFGHEDWTGRIGGDYRMYPNDRMEIRFGPRLFFGTDSYAEKYYSVSAAESLTSGFPVYNASGGLLRVGAEASINYDIRDKWDFTAAVGYDRLIGSAGDSPFVTVAGSEDQWTARIGFTRAFSWRF